MCRQRFRRRPRKKRQRGERLSAGKRKAKRYEAVIEKSGKEWGVKIDANGKVLGKHDESKEKGEKDEHRSLSHGCGSAPKAFGAEPAVRS